jgi:hypothetical protein
MGLFDLFRGSTPEGTAKRLCEAYRAAISKRAHPKEALCSAYRAVAKQNQDLAHVPPEEYFVAVFEEDFVNLSSNPKVAKEFVVRAMMNLMSAYLHPEISSMREAMNFTVDSFGSFGKNESRIKSLIENNL